MLTTALILLPILFALLVLFSPAQQAKFVALTSSVLQLGVTLFALFKFQKNAETQFDLHLNWISSLGISFHVAMDGISLLMVLLTNALLPLIIYSSFSKNYSNPSAFYALVLFMQSALVGVFTAQDGFLFYVFWELALIPIYFICLLWGGKNRSTITFKFFLYTLAGSLFMLVALIYLYLHTPGVHSFDINSLYEAGKSLNNSQQFWVFWGLFIAFAIKMPIFPFHTWQPDTYTVAPVQGTMLLSGIMLKMGIYGLIRWLLPVVSEACEANAGIVLVLSVTGIVYASLIAWAQDDLKRLIAYSSIAHVGLIAAGVFSLSAEGIQGAVYQMISHGFNVFALFLLAEGISERTGSFSLSKQGGVRSVAPVFATLFMIVMMGSVALPLTNGFPGEFLLLNGIYQYSSVMAIFAGTTIILGAVYMLNAYQKSMLGNLSEATMNFTESSGSEKQILLLCCALVIIMGIFPGFIMEIAEPSVKMLLSKAGYIQ